MKPNGYWTKERCHAEALKYTNCTDFVRGSSAACDFARRSDFWKEITSHFVPRKKPSGYWTKEQCSKAAKECTTHSEFKNKFPGGSRIATKHGWYKEITQHFVSPRKPMGYWNKERCAELALLYSSTTDFVTNDPVAYHSARDKGFLDEITKHFIPRGNSRTRIVYEISDHDRRIVYVGLTYNLEMRRSAHKGSKRILEAFGQDFRMVALTERIPADMAAEKEAYYINYYKLLDYRVLNKAKAGGLGGGPLKWTKERCIEEALKYSTRTKFQRNAGGCYAACWSNGWLDEVCDHMPKITKWSRELCELEAAKYSNIVEFRKGSLAAYSYAKRAGFLDEIFPYVPGSRRPHGYWTKERCHAEALKYQTRSEFKFGSPTACSISRRDGFIDDICGHMASPHMKRGHWCFENVKSEALLYETRTAFARGNSAAYDAAQRNGWIDNVCAHMPKVARKGT